MADASLIATPAHEVVPGLVALGGVVPADGRLSWLPSAAGGYQPINCYLVVDPREDTLVDTGVAAHRNLVLAGLAERAHDKHPLAVFLTRNEYDCIGNLSAIVETRPITALYTGGITNPFDAFDEITSYDVWVKRRRLGTITPGAPVTLGNSPRISVLAAPIRILATYWAYDEVTKTLFTSDVFGHGLMPEPTGPRSLSTAGMIDEAAVRAHLLAKFGWLSDAGKVGVIREHLEEVWATHDVAVIAPTHGQVFAGYEIVSEQHHLVTSILRGFESRIGTRARAHPRRSVPATIGPMPPAGEIDSTKHRDLPRRIADGIHWLGKCVEGGSVPMRGSLHHSHLSMYLLIGSDASLLIDTGVPSAWRELDQQVSEILDGRSLTWIMPTHPEYPHSGNLAAWLSRYERAAVIGDVRDYHLFFPGIEERLVARPAGAVLDLGGLRCEFVPAVLRDLPSTVWLYEQTKRILFAADGFSYFHREPEGIEEEGVPVHVPGECGLRVSELDAPLDAGQAVMVIANALSWSRYVDAGPLFDHIDRFLEERSVQVIAPAHGNLIDDLATALPILRHAHAVAYEASPPRPG